MRDGLVVVGMNIPPEFEPEIHADFAGFDVADVDDPDSVGAVVVGFGHLLPDQPRRRGVEPGVGTGAAKVTDMVVDAGGAGALLFVGRGKLADVAEVIVS